MSPSTRRQNATRLALYKAKKAANSDDTPSSEGGLPPGLPPGVGRSPPGLHLGEDTNISNSTTKRDDPRTLDTSKVVDVPH